MKLFPRHVAPGCWHLSSVALVHGKITFDGASEYYRRRYIQGADASDSSGLPLFHSLANFYIIWVSRE